MLDFYPQIHKRCAGSSALLKVPMVTAIRIFRAKQSWRRSANGASLRKSSIPTFVLFFRALFLLTVGLDMKEVESS